MGLPKGRLLIVDDEDGIRKILSEILRQSASSIQTASNGKEALALIKAGSPDVVLSDINMPMMSGLDLLAQVRSMGVETPFVFLTGYGDKEKAIEALRLGATDFLEKPFNPDVVIEVIGKAFELSQAMKEVEENTEKLFSSLNVPADEKIRLHKMKQAVIMMRKAMKIYTRP
jgi:YesN/AraC family two-component response regulator